MKNQPYNSFIKEQNKFQLLILYHILCISLFAIGIYVIYVFFQNPDEVLIFDKGGNAHVAHTSNLTGNRIVIKDIAYKATYALLARTYKTDSSRLLKSYFLKKAEIAAEQMIEEESRKFESRKIVQSIKIKKTFLLKYKGYPAVIVKGTLRQVGEYHDILIAKDKEFSLVLLLKKSDDKTQLPYRVLAIKLKLKSIEDQKENIT